MALATASRSSDAGSLDGKWKQGPLRENFTVHQWLPGCGPAPVNSNAGGGEQVTITAESDELSIVGGGRVFRTNQCYDQLPTLVRDSHTREGSGRVWRTRCSTPPADPRRAVINTLVTVSSDTRVEISETGRYEITLKEGRCIADVKRSRAFDLVQAAAAESAAAPTASAPSAPSAPRAAATEEPAPRQCATPGEPARLEVRPSRKLMRTGESFDFRAAVRDAKGCATSTATSWSATPSADGKARVEVDANGHVTVLADAPEGAVEIVVTAAGKSAKVVVEVSSPANYEALLAQSGLNALGENDEAAVAVLATGTLGGRDTTAEDDALRRRNTFIAIVGGLAAILGIVAIVGWRRTRKAAKLERELELRHEQKLREVEERRREKAARHAAQMKAHEESVQRAVDAAQTHDVDAPGLVCPTCAREYPPGSTFCADDGGRLVELGGPGDGDELGPYPPPAARSTPPKARGKICPTCGGRFDGSAVFCGKDGTALVLLN